MLVVFGPIVYNRSKVDRAPKFPSPRDFHVISIDQWNQTVRLYEIQLTVIDSHAILVVETLKCRVKWAIYTARIKTLAHWQKVQT